MAVLVVTVCVPPKEEVATESVLVALWAVFESVMVIVPVSPGTSTGGDTS